MPQELIESTQTDLKPQLSVGGSFVVVVVLVAVLVVVGQGGLLKVGQGLQSAKHLVIVPQ